MMKVRLFKRKGNTPTDILTVKTAQLSATAKEAEDAVSLVSTALNRMKSASYKMKTHMDDIDTYCGNLMTVREQLDKNYAHNEAVIANFSKLLCVEDE
jgi:hypothetical protein